MNGFGERRKDCICGGNLAGKIQMCVDIGCGSDVTVPQPFLDFFQANAIGIQQAMVDEYTIIGQTKQKI